MYFEYKYYPEQLIGDLPPDIKNNIFYNYILLKPECDYFLNWLENNYMLKRPCTEVEDLVNKLLKSESSVEYLRAKNSNLNHTYVEHFIKNKKNFDLMNMTNSFIASILMYMWH